MNFRPVYAAITTSCLALTVATAGCSKPDANDGGLAAQNGAPSASAVAAGQAATGTDNGGKISAQITGAKNASTEIHDAGFCVTVAPLGKDTMRIFAFGGNNAEWSVTITGMEGTPAVGKHDIHEPGTTGYSGGVSDKTTGKAPEQWQRYEATAGSVTFTSVTPTKVEGSFTITASPTGPLKTGPAVTASGTFSAPQTHGC